MCTGVYHIVTAHLYELQNNGNAAFMYTVKQKRKKKEII